LNSTLRDFSRITIFWSKEPKFLQHLARQAHQPPASGMANAAIYNNHYKVKLPVAQQDMPVLRNAMKQKVP
jgi:hypothetical protein